MYKCSKKKKIFKFFRQRYDKGQLKLLNVIQKSRRKIQNLCQQEMFFERCIQNKVVPNFIRHRIARSKLKSSPTVERTFMRDEIGKCVSTRHFVKSNYLNDLNTAFSWLSNLDRLRFLRHLVDLDKIARNKKLLKQDQSIEFLKSKRFGKFQSSSFSDVLNLSSYTPNSTESFVLSHGLKFCIPPRNLSREIVFSEFEVLSGQLKHHTPNSKTDLDRLNAKLCDLSHAFCGTPVDSGDFRMRRECYEAYDSLKSNPDIVLTKADKGSNLVILDRDKYNSKMLDILSDNSKFVKLGPASKLDFTAKIELAFQRKLIKYFNKGYISKLVYDEIRPNGSQRPKLYGLPKTHKTDCPLRPILSMVGSPQHGLARFLISVLKPVLNKFAQHTVSDSFSFVKHLRTLRSNKNVMCSFDIKSLFTNVPLREVLEICVDQLYNSEISPPNFPKDVCYDLLKLATTNVEFSFDNTMYRQIDGVAMGSPLGPILANIFVGYQESRLFKIIKKPIAYFRYVDDIFAVFSSHGQMNKFYNKLSCIHSALTFTKEDEVNNSIAFLDVLIERSKPSFSTSVYRKSSFTGDYILWSSFCPKRYKINLISCLANRALKICSPSKLDTELENVANIFSALGYPEHVIKSTICRTVERFQTPRPFGPKKCPVYLHLPYIGNVSSRFEEQTSKAVESTYHSVHLRVVYRTRRPLNGVVKDVSPITELNNTVYKFKCHCSGEYIGRTSCRLHIRRDQHVTMRIRKWIDNDFNDPPTGDATAIGEHLLSSPECARHFHNGMFTILARGRTPFHLSVLESLFIRTRKPIFCRQKQYIYKTNLFKMLS